MSLDLAAGGIVVPYAELGIECRDKLVGENGHEGDARIEEAEVARVCVVHAPLGEHLNAVVEYLASVKR